VYEETPKRAGRRTEEIKKGRKEERIKKDRAILEKRNNWG
jgi:hypothetical protein